MTCPTGPPEDILNAISGDLVYENAMKWMLRNFLAERAQNSCHGGVQVPGGSDCRLSRLPVKLYCDSCRAVHYLETLKEQKRL